MLWYPNVHFRVSKEITSDTALNHTTSQYHSFQYYHLKQTQVPQALSRNFPHHISVCTRDVSTNRSCQHYTGLTGSDPPQQQTHVLQCPLARLDVNCYTDRKSPQCLNLQPDSGCVYVGQCVWCGCEGTGVAVCQVMYGRRIADWNV